VGQIMENEINNNPEAYRAAFDEASEELKQIFGEIEQLHLRRTHIEKAVEVLGRKIGTDQPNLTFLRRNIWQEPGWVDRIHHKAIVEVYYMVNDWSSTFVVGEIMETY